MAKQLNVNLAFSADTSQAKAQIQNLQNSLNNLLKSTNINSSFGLNTEINQAIANAVKLKASLDSATNTKTGQLDLGKFNENLQKSGLKLKDYAKSLQDLGPEGDKAFLQLAQAITTAEVPLRRANNLLTEFGTTLKNTARWQISSSILHGFESAISGAWNYAKDLNESLNDIRIVTGQNTEQMAKFAEQANKAAKNLGTTTTKYTDAALIYYQQGLTDEEVQKRTDTTIKMANVTGENAEDVSSYMTAIWNNFDDGSQSLEYYADVITKLGADTAASSEEIANGLEKFASVGQTIGLSYKYATAALTTIIDKTRQSEDVVGTALKTIFARIQGLTLGEETEEGYDLNKYSQALAQYGISIFNANNEMRDMDAILDDMGAKWKELNRAEKTALAQTVAGVRQYTQLVSLMDNWDAMKQNLTTAVTSEGSLNEQAEIYAESWEAASNKVKAAWQGIYDSLIDDDFIIDLTNDFADFLSIVERLIDSMGGFKGVMTVVGAVMMKIFSDDITSNLENMAYNIKSRSSSGRQEILDLRKDANTQLRNLYANHSDSNESIKADAYKLTADLQDKLIIKQEALLRSGKSITEEEQKQAQILLEINKTKNEELFKIVEEKKQQDLINSSLEKKLQKQLQLNATNFDNQVFSTNMTNYKNMASDYFNGFGALSAISQVASSTDIKAADKLKSVKQIVKELTFNSEDLNKRFSELGSVTNIKKLEEKLKGIKINLEDIGENADDAFRSLDKLGKDNLNSVDYKTFKATLNELNEAYMQNGELSEVQIKKFQELSNFVIKAGENIDNFSGKIYTAADGITALASMMMNLTMAIQGIQNFGSIWEDEDLSTGERILQIMTSMSMILPGLMESYKSLQVVLDIAQKSQALLVLGLGKENKAIIENILSTKTSTLGKKESYIIQKLVAQGISETTAKTIAHDLIDKGHTKTIYAKIAANLGLKASLTALMGPIALIAAAIAALVAVGVLWYNNTHEARLELKEAQKNLEETKTAFDNVATSIENVNNKLNELDGAYDTLKNLKRGSAEWQQELDKINSSMIDIIEQYGLVEGKDYFRNEELALELTDEGKKEVNQRNKEIYTKSKYTLDAAEFAVGYNEVEALKEEIAQEYKYSSNTKLYDPYKVENGVIGNSTENSERKNLSDEDINKVVTAINASPTLDLSNQQELIKAGFSEGSANLITSNSVLQAALKDLAIKVEANTQTYAEKITNTLIGDDHFNNAIAFMETMQGVDTEGYQTGIIEKAGEEIAAMVHSAIESGIYNEDLSSYKDEYAKAKGYKKSSEKYYETNEDGDIDLSQEVKIDEDQLKYWVAQKEAIDKYLKSFNKMKDTVENSKKVWAAADNIKKSWDNGKKSLNAYRTTWDAYSKEVEKNGKKSDKAINLKKTLDENIKGIQEYTKSIKIDFANLLGIEEKVAENILTPEFALENEKIIEGAINGNIDDLEALGEAAALQNLSLNVDISNEAVRKRVDELHNWLSEYDNTINLEIGANVNDQEFINKCNEIITAAGMTSEQAQQYFQDMGYDVELNPGFNKVPAYEYAIEYTNEYGPFGRLIKSTPNILEIPYEKKVTAPTIKTITPNGKGFGGNVIKRSSDTGSSSGSGNSPVSGSGSGSKTKVDKIDRTKKSDIIDRYKEINDSLEDQSNILEKVNKQIDRLYGKDKINNLKQANKEIEKENKLLKEKEKEAKEYLKTDKKALQNALDKARKEAGLKESDFKFDKDGDIINYESQLAVLYKKLSAAEKSYNATYAGKAETDASKAAKEKIEELQEVIDNLKDTISQYDETKVLIEDLQEQIQDNLNEIQDNNFEALTHEIEIRVIVNENDKKELEYYFNKLSDDVYKSAEALALLYSSDKNDLIENATSALYNNEDAVNKLKIAYQNGKISQADYIDGMQEQHDSIYANLEELQELDKQMKEYYGDTLDKAAEELAKYTDRMNHLTSVLDHYKSILELTGKGQDYAAMDKILQGQAKTLKNNYDVAKSNYEMLLKQKETIQDRLATMSETDAAYEVEKQKLDDIIAVTDEAYDEMLDDAEEYLSALQEIWENYMEQIKEITSEALTGGMGFDSLMDSLNNLKTYQNEYLTDTNKLFETNKLLSQVQGDIDKTNNIAAKQRLNNFAKEIEQLQQKDKLSNLELEIAQAKYKQLQAQIALEEAQNAKSMVRLSRDNEGNYGYVYTSDQDAINDAEDELAQAENDLYNIRLNATNEYGEKMLQAEQEYLDAVQQAYRDHADDEITLQNELARIKQEYYQLIASYSEQYAIAQEEDTRVVADAWINQYDTILKKGDEWKATLNDYVVQIQDKFIEWQTTSETVTSAIGVNMDVLGTSIDNVTTESDELAKLLDKTVIPELEEELIAVDNITAAYAAQREVILEVIDALEKLAQQTKADMEIETESNEWNERMLGTGKYQEATYQGEDRFGNYHYASSQKTLDEIIKQANSLSDEANEVNQKRSEIVNNRRENDEKVYQGTDKYGILHYAKTKEKLEELIRKANKKGAPSFDTGGYTGEWGPEGKLAMLHEKEIILNPEDTTNILKVVELVRAMIDSNAAQTGLGILQASTVADNRQTLEQTVSITAEFPNATDHNEIELAFDSLINRATQYANRK